MRPGRAHAGRPTVRPAFTPPGRINWKTETAGQSIYRNRNRVRGNWTTSVIPMTHRDGFELETLDRPIIRWARRMRRVAVLSIAYLICQDHIPPWLSLRTNFGGLYPTRVGLFSRRLIIHRSLLDPSHTPGLDYTPETRGYPLDSTHTLQIAFPNSLQLACVSTVQVALRHERCFRYNSWHRSTN